MALLTILVGSVLWRLAPPPPKSADAPTGELSGGRAYAILTHLAGNGAPHPVGSLAQMETRQRVAEELRRIGYTVREERDFVCLDLGICTFVRNLVAELPGRNPRSAVVLAAR